MYSVGKLSYACVNIPYAFIDVLSVLDKVKDPNLFKKKG